MITNLDAITLKSGETVQAAVITAPEPTWAPRMIDLLSHKGDPWNWQNAAVLERELELDAFFYILYRDDASGESQPFANIMTIERNGVGIFGHVWTKPGDRRKGASALLMKLQMEHFRQRNGRALYLTTGNPVAHRLYEKQGFIDLAPESELMVHTADPLPDFEASYFGKPKSSAASIQPLDWRHWPAACPLLMGGSAGVVRAASLGLIGRSTPEGAFLPLLQKSERNPMHPPQAMILALESGAVVGIAVWGTDPIWPDTCIVDLFCHEEYWSHGQKLLDSLELPKLSQYVAYSDFACPQKNQILRDTGFVQQATLPNWLEGDDASVPKSDLLLFSRQPTAH